MSITGPQTILLDAHALTLISRDDPAMREWMRIARRTSSTFAISAATLAETTDGSPRDAAVYRVMSRIEVSDVTRSIGCTAGALRAKAANVRKKPRDLTVDALVAATALSLRLPVVVLTSDKPDLDLMLSDSEGVRVYPVN